MNQENQLTEKNSEETEIDLLEIFYLLRAKLVWLILAFVIGGVIAGLHHTISDHTNIRQLQKCI